MDIDKFLEEYVLQQQHQQQQKIKDLVSHVAENQIKLETLFKHLELVSSVLCAIFNVRCHGNLSSHSV